MEKLEVKHVSKYFDGKPVLSDISIELHRGELVCLLGVSGGGKTTLFNIISGLLMPDAGRVLLDGEDITGKPGSISYMLQKDLLLPYRTIEDNVALPLLYAGVPLKERRARAEEALKAVGLEDRIHFLPNQLSGGQCQRVAIARAIAGKPELLLADEPTGALDTKSGNQIMEIFRQLSNEGMTIIMITHEQAIADCADKIYYILDGELRTDAAPTRGGDADV